jgi:hypothetical protein
MSTDNTLPDGIYLDLSFQDYLSLERVGSSGLTAMMEGPSAFWADSWMNPDKQEREESDAMKLGRAYHAARLEPETFERDYCPEFVQADMHEGALIKDADYKEWLKEAGQAQTKAGETVLERAARVEGLGGPMTWHVSRDAWEKNHADKTWIAPQNWAEIKRDAERVRSNPELEALITGGLPEVSILFTDPDTGIKCKVRPDYMGPSWITHLKTWDARSRGKPTNRSIVDTFNYDGHYRTAWFYRMGIAAILDAGLKLRGCDGTILKLTDIDASRASLVAAWQQPQAWEDWFMFVRRQGIPDIRARRVVFHKMPQGVDVQSIGATTEKFQFTPTALAMKASLEVEACLKQIVECSEIYGTDGAPWYPRDMMGLIEDDDFSFYWLESMNEPR